LTPKSDRKSLPLHAKIQRLNPEPQQARGVAAAGDADPCVYPRSGVISIFEPYIQTLPP